MIKDFSKLFKKGQFTPKERALLLIANAIRKERGEKEFLSEGDIYDLGAGWTPESNEEVAEYNRYQQGWRYACYAELDAQTIFLNVKLSYQKTRVWLQDFIHYPIYSELKKIISWLFKVKKVDEKEAVEIINKQKEAKLKNGKPVNEVLGEIAFALAPDDIKEIITDFYNDRIGEELNYLDELVELARLYSVKDFNTIAERVVSKCYNKYAQEYQLFHDYGGLELGAIAKIYAREKNLPYKDLLDKDDLESNETFTKKLEAEAKAQGTTIEGIIKTATLAILDKPNGRSLNALFKDLGEERDFELVASKWEQYKKEATGVLQDYIDKGVLKTGKDDEGEEIITGESLYNGKLESLQRGDSYPLDFVREYKTYVNEYTPEAGLVKGKDGETIDNELVITKDEFFSRFKFLTSHASAYLNALSVLEEEEKGEQTIVDIAEEDVKAEFIKLRNEFIKEYSVLLAFEELFKRVSKAYEIDITYKIVSWLDESKKMMTDFNNKLLEALKSAGFMQIKPHKKQFKTDDYLIDIEAIKPSTQAVSLYEAEFKRLLGEEFI